MTTYASVCSGIESASVAWEPLGMTAQWFSEIEAFPSAVLAHHWPQVPNLGDMNLLPGLIRSGLVPAPDILVGGTPCQAFSVAGLRAGLEDSRGQLTLTYVDILNAIDEKRKGREAVCVWENVPGVLSSKDNAFGCFIAALCGEDEELKPPGKRWANAGAVFGPQRTIAWRTLDAQYFGLAQRRKRVFVVASARNGFDPTKVLFESEGVRRDSPPSREARQETAGGVRAGSTRPDTVSGFSAGNSAKARGIGYTVEGTPPLRAGASGTNQVPTVFAFDSMASNSMKSNNPHSGCREVDLHKCLDAQYNCPSKNQGGNAVLEHDRWPKDATDLVTESFQQNASGELRTSNVGYTLNTNGNASGRNTGMVLRTYPINDKATRHMGASGKGSGNGLGVGKQNDPSPTLTAGDKHAVCIQGSMIGRNDKNGPQGSGLNDEVQFTQNTVDRHAVMIHGTQDPDTSVELSHCLGVHGGANAVSFAQNSRNEVRESDVSGALSTGGGKPGQGYAAVRTEACVRRLTPIECERLQGFLDNHTLIPWRKKQPEDCPDGPRYKAIGNSKAVPVIQWVGKRLLKELK